MNNLLLLQFMLLLFSTCNCIKSISSLQLHRLHHLKLSSLVKSCKNISTDKLFMSLGMSTSSISPSLIFRQLFESSSSTYTYLLGDIDTKECILIDPVLETVERDKKLIDELKLTLKYILNTHVHADHITGSGELKKYFQSAKSVISKSSDAQADITTQHEDIISFGKHSIVCISTPGHTSGCMSYLLQDKSMVFTGDALLIRGCGRTDFQSGSSEELYKSIHSHIFTLPDSTLVYPAHDYKGMMVSSIGEEKQYNPRLTKSKDEFINIMSNLNLAYPKQIDRAVPANMLCGFH